MRSEKMAGERLLKTQTRVCCILIALMMIASFLPIYSVDVEVPSFMQTAMYQVETVLNDPLISGGEDIEFKMPEKLNVNVMLFIRAATKIDDIVDLYKSIMEVAEYRTATTTNEYYQAYNKLQVIAADAKEIINSGEFMDMMALAAVITSASGNSLNMTIVIIMILMTVILPIAMLTALVFALVGWLILHRRSERAYLYMMRVFRRAARVFLIVLALGLLDSSIRMSAGIIVALCLCVFGFAFCSVCSRFKYHTPVGKRYLNIIQFSSAFKLVAFFGYYVCVARSGILGQYIAVVSKDAIKNIFSKDYGEKFLEQYMFMLGALAVIVALVFTLSVLTGTLARWGGMLPRNKETGIFSSLMSVVLIAIPIFESLTDWRIPVDEKGKALLVMASTFTFVMILCDLAVKYLRYALCRDLRETEKDSILRGLQAVETERFDAPEEELTDEMIDELMAPFKEQQEKLSKRRERKKRKKYADI